MFITVFSLLLLNTAVLSWRYTVRQQLGVSRKSLKFIHPLSRWNYPDTRNKSSRKKLLLVGDSYIEGIGDDYLKDVRDYSIAHILSREMGLDVRIAANSGSHLTNGLGILRLLDKNLTWPLLPRTWFSLSENDLTIFAFIYEGNDFDDLYFSRPERLPGGWEFRERMTGLRPRFIPILYLLSALRSEIEGRLNQAGGQTVSKEYSHPNSVCISSTCRDFPPMQSAAASLNDDEIRTSMAMMVDSIVSFKKEFSGNLAVVYIPSPLTIYNIRSSSFQVYGGRKINNTISASENNERSEMIRRGLESALRSHGIVFIDTTSPMKEKAKSGFIHGQIDPKHFNRIGYRTLSEVVKSSLISQRALNVVNK